MNKNTIWIILYFIALAISVWIYIVRQPGINAYNDHVCAVEGFKPDCKTPLK